MLDASYFSAGTLNHSLPEEGAKTALDYPAILAELNNYNWQSQPIVLQFAAAIQPTEKNLEQDDAKLSNANTEKNKLSLAKLN